MTDGARRVLLIAMAAILAIALMLVAAAARFAHGMTLTRERLDARATAFCDSIVLGSDVASLATQLRRPNVSVDAANGTTDYRYRFFGGAYWEADCRVTADA